MGEGRTESGLDDEQIATLRRALERKREELVRAGQLRADRLRQTGDEPVEAEAVDRAERTSETGDDAALATRHNALLSEVERALSKVDEGRYGISEATGQPIPLERLRAIPWARDEIDEG